MSYTERTTPAPYDSAGAGLRGSKSNGSMQLLDYKPVDFSLTAGTDIPPPPPSPPPKILEVESNPLPPSAAYEFPPPASPSALPPPVSPSAEAMSPPHHAASEAPLSPSISPRANNENSGRRLSKFLSLKSLNAAYDPAATSTTPNPSTPNLLASSAASPSSSRQNNYSSAGASPFDRKRPSTPSVASSSMTATKRVRSWFRRKRKISDLTPGDDDADSGRPQQSSRGGDADAGLGGSTSNSAGPSPAQAARARGPPPPRLPTLNKLSGKKDKNGLSSLGGGDMFRDIK